MLRIRSHMSNETFLMLLLVAGIIIFLSWYFSRSMMVKRKLKQAPLRPVQDYLDGDTGKINGRVKIHDSSMNAPLSGRKCAYYYIRVEEKGNKAWHTIIEEETKNRVLVKDGNHYALVDTSIIKTHIITDRQFTSAFLNDASSRLKEYLKKHNKSSEGIFGLNKTIKYFEGVLEEDEMISVAGRMKWRSTSELRLKLPVSRVLCIEGDNDAPVYLSDDPDVTLSAQSNV